MGPQGPVGMYVSCRNELAKCKFIYLYRSNDRSVVLFLLIKKSIVVNVNNKPVKNKLKLKTKTYILTKLLW